MRHLYILFSLLFLSFIAFGESDNGSSLGNEIQQSISLKSSNELRESAINSVLSSGTWKKIKTTGSGIYKLSYNQLKSMGIGDPANVRIYGNGGYGLPMMNNETYPDDLAPVPILRGKDVNNNDCVWFYVSGPDKVYYDSNYKQLAHKRNLYSDEAYYFLSDDAGDVEEIKMADAITEEATATTSTFEDFKFYDEDKYNLIESGRRWFGQVMSGSNSASLSFDFGDIAANDTLAIEVMAIARAYDNTTLDIAVNGVNKGSLNFVKVDGGATAPYAKERKTNLEVITSSGEVDMKLSYNASKSTEKCWVDYIRVTARRELKLSGSQLSFRDTRHIGSDKVLQYKLSNTTSATKIWDVTDIWNPIEMPITEEGAIRSFKANADQVRHFVAFDTKGSFPSPELVGDISNQNLHGGEGMDMIIVSHPNFLAQANELAEFHRNDEEALQVKVVTPQEVYNEFSSGAPDVAAIRNYARLWYNRTKESTDTKLRYLLLMGDGCWDNKSNDSNTPNYILTYQSWESLYPTSSFVSDDFFGLLDTNEGEYIGGLDLGIGRIPCNSAAEAQLVVDKIKNYASPASYGAWRNNLTFIADDGDRNIHMSQAEEMTQRVGNSYPSFIFNKIFFDAYQQENTSAGQKYPAVNQAISKSVDEGTLILNYTGHAGYRGLADEQVLQNGEIDSWTNFNKLPIFVTATCEFSRYDLKEEVSSGEHILMNPKGGGIALFSTTRLVFSNQNFQLNKSFYNYVFEQDENGKNYRLGDIIRLSKSALGSSTNKRNFSLLGDPALRITYPRYHVKTTHLNDIEVGSGETPQFKALSEVSVKGEITDHQGNKLSDFNGDIIPLVFDKDQTRSTLGNEGDPFDFQVRENILFKGGATVTDGEFQFAFKIPKDISYNLGSGKICYYASNNEGDAHGYAEDFLIGGGTAEGVNDIAGPELTLYMNDESFVAGDKVTDSPWLIAKINDESGINTVGTGIGHDITAILDGNTTDVIVLNNYFQSDKDQYTSGQVVFPLSGLERGEHTLTVKVWDVLNNSTESEITFIVDELDIQQVICYPNPATESYANFELRHNNPGDIFDVTIRIFSSIGTIVDEIETRAFSNGVTTEPIRWDFASRDLAGGIYYYQVTARNTEGTYESEAGRLIIK